MSISKVNQKIFVTKEKKTINIYRINFYSNKFITISLPQANCVDLVDYINEQHRIKPKSELNGMKIEQKFEIYISDDDKKKFIPIVKDVHSMFKKNYQIDDPEINIGYGRFKSVANNDLYKIKIMFDKFSQYIINKYDKNKSVKIQINGLSIFSVDDKYYVNILAQDIKFVADNYDHLIFNPDEMDNYRAPICEISKLKQSYKPYFMSFEKSFKNKKVSVDI